MLELRKGVDAANVLILIGLKPPTAQPRRPPPRKMVQRYNLTEKEKGQIDILDAKNYSGQSIGNAIGRSEMCVNGYTKRKKQKKRSFKVGMPRNLSERAERALENTAQKGRMMAKKVLNQIPVNVSLRTVQRILQENENIGFGPLKVRPSLFIDHVKACFKSCKANIKKVMEDWRRVVFADENRFVLDGPGGQAKFGKGDRRLPPDIFSKRARGSGGIMVWAGISWRGKTPLVVVGGNFNAVRYTELLVV